MPNAVGPAVALVVTIGLADSLNPSTIAPATALALREDGARRAAAFTAGVGVVSLLGGLLLVAGPGQAIIAAIPHPSARVKRIGELVVGIVLLGLALAAWLARGRIARSMAGSAERRGRGGGARGAFALGAGIMAVELPTAFPYFGAVAAIVATHASLTVQILLVVVFNLAFLLPLVVIVVVRAVAGERAAQRLQRFRAVMARYAGTVLAVLLAAGGVVLLGFGGRIL